jgi:hypothetical protein
MKNLIEEIEKLRDLSLDGCLGDIVCRTCSNETIDKVIELLNQYNIITAPKQIKLSEIVNKLNSCDEHNDFNVIIKADSIVIENYAFKQEYFYIRNNKMFDLSDYMVREEYKFLYALWIAGTIIEDDVESDE